MSIRPFSSSSSFASPYPMLRPLVLAVHVAVAALAVNAMTPQMAAAADAAAASNVKSYQIVAGPLTTVLGRFAAEAGVALSFDPALTAGLQSSGLQGNHSVDAGFALLLSGTGLQAERQSGGGFVLRKAGAMQQEATLPAVTATSRMVVDAYIATRSASTKQSGPLLETPRSISVVTQEQIKAQSPTNIEQALAYTAGVATEVAGADVRMSGATIRGFSDGSAYYKDGLKQLSAGTYASWNDDIDDLESIEVVKGPASVLYGQGRPGGVVNVVSKRPTSDHVNSVGLSYGTYDRRQLNADLGGVIDDGGSLLYRVNVTARDSDGRTTGSRDDRLSIAPSLRWNISDRTHLTVLGSYSEERGTPKTWWPSFFVYPQIKNVSDKLTAGDPSFDRFDRDTHALGYVFEHQSEDGWRFVQNLRYSVIDIDYRHIYADSLLADQHTVTRANLAQLTKGKTLAVDSRAQKDFRWGDVQHNMVLGIDYLKYKEDTGLGFGWSVPNLDTQAPVYGRAIDYPELDWSSTDLKQTGLYTLNQLKWKQWVANVSLRHDVVRTTQTSTTQPRMNDEKTTGSIGVLYLLGNGWAPYASYSTSFDPVTGRQYDGAPFEPRTGKQYEVGLKYQAPDSATMITASAFDLYQTNVTTQDPDHPTFQVQTGEVRSTGVELEAKMELTRQLNAMASYTWLDPRTTKSNRPAEIGRQTMQTARHMANIWLDYRPAEVPGLMVAGGVRYKDRMPYQVSSDGSIYATDSYTLADFAVVYETAKYRVALNVNNVFDKKFYSGIFLGAERQAVLSVKYYW